MTANIRFNEKYDPSKITMTKNITMSGLKFVSVNYKIKKK